MTGVGQGGPVREQLRRTKGWRMPENTVSVARPGRWGNPFQIGGWFKVGTGAGRPGFAWLQAAEGYQDSTFTLVQTREQAVAMFRLYNERYPLLPIRFDPIRGKNLACWCPLDQPCHADVLLELANPAAIRALEPVREMHGLREGV